MERQALIHMRNSGFTLLELMVTVSLLVILIGIGIPSLNSLLRDNNLSFQSELLLKYIRFARSQAIDNQQTVTACLADATDVCVRTNPAQLLIFIDSNSNSIYNTTEILLARSPTLPTSMSATANRTATTYRSDGTSIGTNGTFSLCETGANQMNIVVAQSGRVSAEQQTTVCP